jgi:signal transduction histidine kinase
MEELISMRSGTTVERRSAVTLPMDRLEKVPVALGLVHPLGTLLYANRALRLLLRTIGADPEELVSGTRLVVMPRWPLSPQGRSGAAPPLLNGASVPGRSERGGAPTTLDVRVTWLGDDPETDVHGLLTVLPDTRIAEDERDLFRRLVNGLEDEKEETSLEIHDGVLRYVTDATHHLQMLQFAPPAELPDRVGTILGLLRQAAEESRNLATGLRPASLERLGLVKTIRGDLASLVPTGVRSTVDFDATDLPKGTETTLYRIASEALHNVKKHARARNVTVYGYLTDQCVGMTICDDGIGFDPASVGAPTDGDSRLGLIAMQARARMAGGSLQVISAPGRGTTVAVTLPLSTAGPGRTREEQTASRSMWG